MLASLFASVSMRSLSLQHALCCGYAVVMLWFGIHCNLLCFCGLICFSSCLLQASCHSRDQRLSKAAADVDMLPFTLWISMGLLQRLSAFCKPLSDYQTSHALSHELCGPATSGLSHPAACDGSSISSTSLSVIKRQQQQQQAAIFGLQGTPYAAATAYQKTQTVSHWSPAAASQRQATAHVKATTNCSSNDMVIDNILDDLPDAQPTSQQQGSAVMAAIAGADVQATVNVAHICIVIVLPNADSSVLPSSAALAAAAAGMENAAAFAHSHSSAHSTLLHLGDRYAVLDIHAGGSSNESARSHTHGISGYQRSHPFTRITSKPPGGGTIVQQQPVLAECGINRARLYLVGYPCQGVYGQGGSLDCNRVCF